ncbi:MAG: ATP-binding cassette domain-containing protein, partial [Candidatus Melainabacteria bacterium]|nr:ATP-binding cassette domain-containing protein [Candidatus Melainabacteria bacterium]
SLADLRRNIGVVSQHEYLFRGTVRENLSLYKPEATLDEIIEAATIAGIHDFVLSLPMGYETPLSEGGFNVSGGQRQRLAIARAILHKPRILIFDEATSALDSESERRIQSSMETIRRGRTMFVVAHRLSTVRDADMIFVIDRGQIVEKGNHESLVTEKGLYYYLCSQQLAL